MRVFMPLPAGLVQVDENGAVFTVRVTPRASRDAVGPVVAGSLTLRVAAPPVEGEANQAVIELIASALGLPKRAVQILRGERGRRKVVRVVGAPLTALEKLFA